jgi:rhodanese-related sulfurtransferase
MDLSQEEWKNQFEADENAFLLDVRTLGEFEEGHIPNATLLGHSSSRSIYGRDSIFGPLQELLCLLSFWRAQCPSLSTNESVGH